MNTLLKVKRYIFNKDWTISKILVQDKLDGYAVEDEIRETNKVHGETAISYGTYLLGYRQSPKFSSSYLWSDSTNMLILPKDKANYPKITDWKNHDLIWIKDVPEFQYILLHWGNTDDDTEGCLIVGKYLGAVNGQEGVVQSRVYYKDLYQRIYPLIKKGNQYIEYSKVITPSMN